MEISIYHHLAFVVVELIIIPFIMYVIVIRTDKEYYLDLISDSLSDRLEKLDKQLHKFEVVVYNSGKMSEHYLANFVSSIRRLDENLKNVSSLTNQNVENILDQEFNEIKNQLNSVYKKYHIMYHSINSSNDDLVKSLNNLTEKSELILKLQGEIEKHKAREEKLKNAKYRNMQ